MPGTPSKRKRRYTFQATIATTGRTNPPDRSATLQPPQDEHAHSERNHHLPAQRRCREEERCEPDPGGDVVRRRRANAKVYATIPAPPMSSSKISPMLSGTASPNQASLPARGEPRPPRARRCPREQIRDEHGPHDDTGGTLRDLRRSTGTASVGSDRRDDRAPQRSHRAGGARGRSPARRRTCHRARGPSGFARRRGDVARSWSARASRRPAPRRPWSPSYSGSKTEARSPHRSRKKKKKKQERSCREHRDQGSREIEWLTPHVNRQRGSQSDEREGAPHARGRRLRSARIVKVATISEDHDVDDEVVPGLRGPGSERLPHPDERRRESIWRAPPTPVTPVNRDRRYAYQIAIARTGTTTMRHRNPAIVRAKRRTNSPTANPATITSRLSAAAANRIAAVQDLSVTSA